MQIRKEEMLSPLDPTNNMSLKAACPPSTSKTSEVQGQFLCYFLLLVEETLYYRAALCRSQARLNVLLLI